MNLDKTLEHTIAAHIDTLCEPSLNHSMKVMGIKHAISLSDDAVNLHLKAGFPITLCAQNLQPLLADYLSRVFPNRRIDITFETCIRPHRTQMPSKGLKSIKNTIAVGSGKGGVGKSTVSLNLAITLAKAGARVGILDADIYGPSLPLMLGSSSESPIPITDDNRYYPLLTHGIQAMSIAYLMDATQALIWRGPMLAKSLLHMLDYTQWDDLDYLFIDLPPGTGDIALSLTQKIPLTAAIVVTTPQNVATLDAQKAIQLFKKTQVHVLGLIENMSLHTCSQCGQQEPIFGNGGAEALCETYQLNLLGQLPLDRRIQESCDSGNPSLLENSPELSLVWQKIALNTAIALTQQPLNYADKFPDIRVEV